MVEKRDYAEKLCEEYPEIFEYMHSKSTDGESGMYEYYAVYCAGSCRVCGTVSMSMGEADVRTFNIPEDCSCAELRRRDGKECVFITDMPVTRDTETYAEFKERCLEYYSRCSKLLAKLKREKRMKMIDEL